jgi:putative transposase
VAIRRTREIPRAQRFAGRPSLEQLFAGVTTRQDRDALSVTAVREHGYSMKEIAEFLGRHYVTVSRALARAEGGR